MATPNYKTYTVDGPGGDGASTTQYDANKFNYTGGKLIPIPAKPVNNLTKPSPTVNAQGSYLGYNPTKASMDNLPFGTPSYSSLLNKAGTGWAPSLSSTYTLKDTYNPAYIKDYANQATSNTWLNMMNSQIGLQKQQGYDDQTNARLGGLRSAQDQMAMRGGMSSGAGVGLQRSSLRDLMMNAQSGSMAANQAYNQAGIQDQTNKLSIMQQLPGMEQSRNQQALGVQQSNIASLMGERANQYGAGQGTFDTLMKAWAAQQQANATSNAANKPTPMGQLFGAASLGAIGDNPYPWKL